MRLVRRQWTYPAPYPDRHRAGQNALLQPNPLPREERREDPDAFKSLMEERADTEDNAPMYRY